ncbi:MAG: SHD1 domain-containing protein [Pirellulaceae bacterium]|nr:SHD1 domain-containing protein [Pirellulaceae bacterium]
MISLTLVGGEHFPIRRFPIRQFVMKRFNSFVIFAALMPWTLVHAQEGADDEQKTIELATDNPDTLIGTTSDRFTVHGVRLGMTQEQVMQVLRTQDSLIAAQTSWIQVFTKGPGGVRGKDPIFTLNWDLGPQSPVITVTDRSTEWLPPNLQRLLKESNSERPSAFVENFLGPVSSRKTDLKYQKAGIIVHLASYDAIGLIVQRTQSRTGTRVSLKLTEAAQKPNAAAPVREWTDDTGQFKIRATLVQVADGKVTLRKEDGKEIVVSLARLSAADRDFLKQQE